MRYVESSGEVYEINDAFEMHLRKITAVTFFLEYRKYDLITLLHAILFPWSVFKRTVHLYMHLSSCYGRIASVMA